ncbi:ATP synthase subunit f, mitochondrial [Alligator mississippiensis]|uniref:ATP synthase subunit f, mitochondrial n=1 Tax=Alligator mississippiensis TaxID=8496 RepID=A0A151N263_ALLMI|nr:ATP synthase subunit f, mitochondrial [Alligator mississippiensis]
MCACAAGTGLRRLWEVRSELVVPIAPSPRLQAGKKMAKVSTGMELCPFCRKPFKRLKMHLPHCKMAGDERAPLDSRKALPADLEKGHPEPAQLVSTKKKKGQSKGQVSGNSRLEGARGLEWFPELYPSYRRLNAFRGKPLQWDVGIVRRETVPSFSKGQQGPLLEKCLPDVTLGELPVWLVTRDFSPKGLLNTTQTAWNSYYSKYIDMKKGGAVGISMLLAGYCVLSYCWQYEHMKASRWRKYH